MMLPIEKMSTTDKVIESIRTFIQEPGHSPGEKLPTENELSKQLGVGRSSIREALRVLQTMGYVTIVHGKGAFIQSTQPSSEAAERWFEDNFLALNDIYVIRENIEPLVAGLSARNITQPEVEKLRINLQQMRAVADLPSERSNPSLMAQLDTEFHAIICESTQNPLLISMYKQISSSLSRYRQNSFAILRNQKNALAPHEQILDALAAHDEDLARQYMIEHIAISKKDMKSAAKRNDIAP